MATTQWGRKETIIFPPHSPIYTYGAIFLAVVATGLFVYLRFSFALTPLQQFYLPYYLRTQVAGIMHKTDKYQLLAVSGRAESRPPCNRGRCAGRLDTGTERKASAAPALAESARRRHALSLSRAGDSIPE